MPRAWSRWLTVVTVLTALGALLLRVLGHVAWHDVLVGALVLLGIRLVVLVRDAISGRVPWPRLLLPSIVWIEAIGMSGTVTWQVRLGTAIALEITFVAVAIRALCRRDQTGEHVEVRIARALGAVVPPVIARLAAIEMVLAGLAVRFLLGGWRRPVPAGITYHRESGVRTMLPILPLLAAGDVLLLELVVLPHAAIWIRIVVHALAAYGLLWLVGVYASLRARPHRIVGGELELHRGVFRMVTVSVENIASVEPLPSFVDDWKKRAYLKGALRLDLGGATTLEIRLRDGTRLLVAMDDPPAFAAALERARSVHGPQTS